MHARSLAPLVLALAAACACRTDGAARDPAPAPVPTGLVQEPQEVPFEVAERGDQAGLSAPLAKVIRSQQDWDEVWATRARTRVGELPRPEVDWSSDMLALVAIGERTSAGFGIEVLGVERVGSFLRVRVAERRPPPDSLQAQVMTHPYVVLRLPRFEGPVSFVID